jgi:hypothetical protein
MDSARLIEAPPYTNPVIEKVIHTTVLTVELKFIHEVTDSTYADGVTKQDRHDRTEVHFTLDRDDYTEAPTGEV